MMNLLELVRLNRLDLGAIEETLKQHVDAENLLKDLGDKERRIARVELFQKTRMRLADLGLALSEHLFEDWLASRGYRMLNPKQKQN